MMIYAPRLEPFGLAPLEAGACGVPVVAVPEGGVRETILDEITGLHVENDPAAAAAALTRLRNDPELARRLGENGCTAAKEKWSFQGATNRIEQRLQRYAIPLASEVNLTEPLRRGVRVKGPEYPIRI
jgi:glycosyltransferase involved in cell wall biosynthesis